MNEYNFSELELFYILRLFPDHAMDQYNNVNSYYEILNHNPIVTQLILNNVFDNNHHTFYTNIFFNVFKGLPISDKILSYKVHPDEHYTYDLIVLDAPMYHHIQGLSYTRSGYGSKIPTQYKVFKNKRLYRVYCMIYSNAGTLYIIENGEKLILI